MNIRWLLDRITTSANAYPEKVFTERERIYTCINSFKYHLFHKDPLPYQHMDGIFVDGILMCRAIRLLWGKRIKRLSFDMTSIAKDLFPRLCKTGESIYFIGDKESQISASVSRFKESYPQMNVIGFRNGFFSTPEEREKVIKEIVKINPDFLIAGMGGKIQEQFLYDLKEAGFKGIGMTCGGFFHQANQKLHYYPQWVNQWNLRAPYRVIKERNYKRLTHLLITFPFLFLYDSLASKIKK